MTPESAETDEVATPGSVSNMRAKMMQQRERLLAKQKGGAAASGSSGMVMANQGLPVQSPSPTSQRRPLTSQLTGDSLLCRMDSELDDDQKRGAVMPAPTIATKEQEEARRRLLHEELTRQGICPEFDPAASGEARQNFDISSVPPGEMKAFLHSPVPKHAGILQCRVVRDRSNISTKLHPKYTMQSDGGTFMMTAQKQVKNKTSNYAISMSSKTQGKTDDAAYLGKLRSDFLGIEWVAYGPGQNPAKSDLKTPQALGAIREELVAIQYTASKWGATSKGPRKMSVIIPRVAPSGERLECRTMNPQAEGLLALQKTPESTQMIDTYMNKPPNWSDQIGAYVLNFNKRVTEASVKNFQLINSTDSDTVYLQFGRVGKEVFNLDFRHPISPFQAFAMCLSSFDYKLGCE